MRVAASSLAALLLLGAAAADCGRTAPEDFPRPPVPPPTAAPAANAADPAAPERVDSLAGRCILATPAQQPAAVPPGPAPGCPPDPERSGPAPSFARVLFPDSGAASVTVEVVRSPHDTMRGLMYRTSLAEDRGMLFDLGSREDHKFWMHNTCIPLDLLFIDDDGLVVGIVENAPTLNDESRGVGCPSSYVLEVNAGWSRRHGVKAGQRVKLPSGA